MSKPVPIEAQPGSEASRLWRRELEQWRTSFQRVISESLGELREVVRVVDAQIQEESGLNAWPVQPGPSNQVQSPGGSHLRGHGGLEQAAVGTAQPAPVTAAPPRGDGHGTATASDLRLAELARRLEEKLERSGSKTND